MLLLRITRFACFENIFSHRRCYRYHRDRGGIFVRLVKDYCARPNDSLSKFDFVILHSTLPFLFHRLTTVFTIHLKSVLRCFPFFLFVTFLLRFLRTRVICVVLNAWAKNLCPFITWYKDNSDHYEIFWECV